MTHSTNYPQIAIIIDTDTARAKDIAHQLDGKMKRIERIPVNVNDLEAMQKTFSCLIEDILSQQLNIITFISSGIARDILDILIPIEMQYGKGSRRIVIRDHSSKTVNQMLGEHRKKVRTLGWISGCLEKVTIEAIHNLLFRECMVDSL